MINRQKDKNRKKKLKRNNQNLSSKNIIREIDTKDLREEIYVREQGNSFIRMGDIMTENGKIITCMAGVKYTILRNRLHMKATGLQDSLMDMEGSIMMSLGSQSHHLSMKISIYYKIIGFHMKEILLTTISKAEEEQS